MYSELVFYIPLNSQGHIGTLWKTKGGNVFRVGVLHPIKQPGSHWDRSSALPESKSDQRGGNMKIKRQVILKGFRASYTKVCCMVLCIYKLMIQKQEQFKIFIWYTMLVSCLFMQEVSCRIKYCHNPEFNLQIELL